MNTTQTAVATVSTVAIVGVAVAGVVQYNSLVKQVQDRFPEIDKKIARKAYRTMMMKALTGNYAQNLDTMTDADMDRLFHMEVRILTNKK